MMSHPALLINGVWRQGRGAEFGKADPVGNQPLWRAILMTSPPPAKPRAPRSPPGRVRRSSSANSW